MLPWQTVVGEQPVDVEALAVAAGMPAGRALLRRSLRRPGLALAATTVLDLVVVAVSGTGLVASAVPRTLLGLTASGLAIATGRRAGALRRLAGFVSVATAAVQVATAAMGLGQLPPGTGALTVASMIVATASATVMAIRTAVDALARPR